MIPHSSPAPASRFRARWLRGVTGLLMAGLLVTSAPDAEAKRYGGGSGKSFSSGSRSSGSSGGGYSSGRSSYSSGSGSSYSNRNAAPPPSSSRSGYDAAAAKAKQQADSQARYAGSKPPPIPAAASGSNGGTSSTYRSGGATPPPIPAGGSYSSSGGFGGNRGSWGNHYGNRSSYSTGAKAAMIGAAVLAPVLIAYAARPTVHYQDSFGSPFWWWLLDQPRDVRAAWLHHHQTDIDPARRAELLKADPGLQAEVDALTAKKLPVEPGYAPPGLTTADMFTDPAAQEAAAAAEAASRSHSSGSSGLFWITVLGGGAAAAWLVFVKRWKSPAPSTA
jgi:hypothetical protein